MCVDTHAYRCGHTHTHRYANQFLRVRGILFNHSVHVQGILAISSSYIVGYGGVPWEFYPNQAHVLDLKVNAFFSYGEVLTEQ